MLKRLVIYSSAVLIVSFVTIWQAGAQSGANHGNKDTAATTDPSRAKTDLRGGTLYIHTRSRSSQVSPAAAGPNLPVVGGGTIGQLTKWTGFTAGNSVIGDSIITETKFGNIGIGTATPGSKLSVAGLIETTLGGFKFPDGSVQTTSAVNALISVSHDFTMIGSGTAVSPLGVAVPLQLTASVPNSFVLDVVNTSDGGQGIFAFGGHSISFRGGTGVQAQGGDGGAGGQGGLGITAIGGPSEFGVPGDGILTFGGNVLGPSQAIVPLHAGNGLLATGGDATNNVGGTGVLAIGGKGSGFTQGVIPNNGGDGIVARAGAGVNGAIPGRAGVFLGDVVVAGNVSKLGGSFKIDHPLDPANKYLSHSFVESPDMMNIYNGNVTTDSNGDAVIALPDWFEALNRDFRYQLTVMGQFAQAIVSGEVSDNHFAIKTNLPNVKVSWQVTGIRRDAWANAHRIPVEEDKAGKERGHYLRPELFNQPEERSVESANHPELIRQVREPGEQVMPRKQ